MHQHVLPRASRAGLAALLTATALIAASLPATAAPLFVNAITIPATTADLSGDAGVNARLGMFSDLYYDPIRNEYWGLSDRGPGGGTLSYETRVQRFTLDVNPATGAIANFAVAQTVKFTDPSNLLGAGGGVLNGLAPAPSNILGASFDPEGVVVIPKSGNLLVSDEYGPSLYEFNRNGELVRVLQTPDNLIPRNSATSTANFASDAGNDAGKRSNRGYEGLAISPDGKYAFAMLQSAMLDEGGSNGVFLRIVQYDLETGQAIAQFGYQLDGSSQGRGISALVALNDHQFLVLERNNRGLGVPDANLASPNKNVYVIDIAGATDISNLDLTDDGTTLKPGIVLVSKSAQFIDLDANTLAALGNLSPEKWEGLTIGPRLANGQYLILAGTDNDYSITQNSSGTQFDVYFRALDNLRIQCDIGTFSNCLVINANGSLGGAYAGSFDGFSLIPGVLHAYVSTGSDLAAYQAPVPEPATLALFGVPLAALAFARRRRAG